MKELSWPSQYSNILACAAQSNTAQECGICPARLFRPDTEGSLLSPLSQTPATLVKLKQVNIVLESAQVDYRPTMINLTHVINIVTKELMGTIKAVSRVREALGDGPGPNANLSANAAAAAAPHAATGAKKPASTTATGGPVAASSAVEGAGADGDGAAAKAGQPAGEGSTAAGEGGGGGGSLLPVAQVGGWR